MTDGKPTGLTGPPAPARMVWITAALGTCFLGVRWGAGGAPGHLPVVGPPGADTAAVADLHRRTPLKEHR